MSDDQIVKDLMIKAIDDVIRVVKRTTSICPQDRKGSVAAAAAQAALTLVALSIDKEHGRSGSGAPSEEGAMLAGLMIARAIMRRHGGSPLEQPLKDYAAILKSGENFKTKEDAEQYIKSVGNRNIQAA
jgi:uncharacterized membrane-anchored protein